ncbi:MAG: hypothetical protein AB7E05_13690 [Sphingobium sp.]
MTHDQSPDHPKARPEKSPENRPKNRPKNREVENEMLCPPDREGEPPRPVTQPNEKNRTRKE